LNTYGHSYTLSVFGESHGKSVGVTIDGCPPGIPLTVDDFMQDLDRRRAGAKGTTPRKESDIPKIMSGVFNDKTTGAPITLIFENNNIRSKDYSNLIDTPRPGHADFVSQRKYGGFADYNGGGHFSGRMTLCLVSAGVIAKKVIAPVDIKATIKEIGGGTDIDAALDRAIEKHDSVGGIIECRATNMPIGLGEPFFDSVEASIAHLVFSIPAIKGVEFGAGFSAAKMYGSEHNDNFINAKGETETNNAGGINGGISNGNELVFRIVVKPTSSVGVVQKTFNFKKGELEDLLIEGRHDACIALRVPPVLEAVAAIALCDLFLRHNKLS